MTVTGGISLIEYLHFASAGYATGGALMFG
jgi:hypothetical protein